MVFSMRAASHDLRQVAEKFESMAALIRERPEAIGKAIQSIRGNDPGPARPVFLAACGEACVRREGGKEN